MSEPPQSSPGPVNSSHLLHPGDELQKLGLASSYSAKPGKGWLEIRSQAARREQRGKKNHLGKLFTAHPEGHVTTDIPSPLPHSPSAQSRELEVGAGAVFQAETQRVFLLDLTVVKLYGVPKHWLPWEDTASTPHPSTPTHACPASSL